MRRAVVGAVVAGYQSDWNTGAMVRGAVVGAVAGATGYYVAGEVGSAVGGGTTGAVVGGAAGGAVAGGVTAGLTGGNIGQGMLIGGIAGGIGGYMSTMGSSSPPEVAGDFGYGQIQVMSDANNSLGVAPATLGDKIAIFINNYSTEIIGAGSVYAAYQGGAFGDVRFGSYGGGSSNDSRSSSGSSSTGGTATTGAWQNSINGIDFFWKCLASGLASPSLLDLSGPGIAAYYQNRAWNHAVTTPSKRYGTPALMYPLKSRIYQGYITNAGRAGTIGAIGILCVNISQCLYEEWNYYNP